MDAERTTFVIARSRLSDLTGRLDALIGRATKLGVEPLVYEVGPAREIKVSRRHDGTETNLTEGRRVIVHDVTITGSSPKLEGGWRLAAVIDHRQSHPTLGWLVRRTPDFNEIALPENIEHTAPTCDHCGTVRERVATYLLLSDAGEWNRVGRQCLRDFLGHRSAEAIAGYFAALLDLVRDLDDAEDEDEGAGGRQDVMTKTFLTFVAGAVRTAGAYYSRKSEQEDKGPSTATIAWGRLMSDPEKIDPADRTIAADHETADAIIAWGVTLSERPSLSDYERSLAIVLYQEVVASRAAGLLASAWYAWARETNRLPERDTKPSVHQGEIGERIERVVKVARRFDSPSNFRFDSTHYFYILEDADGNIYTWGTEAARMAEGDEVKIKGTVKNHTDYRGKPQTELTRCKVLDKITVNEEAE